MSDVAAALAPVLPLLADAAITIGSLLAGLAAREGVSILRHWFHVSMTAQQQAEIEQAASNAAGVIIAKADTKDAINEAFSINDPRIQAAAKWIVKYSAQHARAVNALAVTVDDLAHKIVAKLGDKQAASASVSPAK